MLFAFTPILRAESYKGRWEVGGVYGGILFEGTSFLNEDEIYGAQVGYNLTENWGVQAGLLGGDVELVVPGGNAEPRTAKYPSSEVRVLIPSLELQYNFGHSRFRPYLGAGIGDLHLDPDSNSHVYGISGSKTDDFIVQYGGGIKWMLNSWLMTRIDLRHIINTEFNYRRFGMPEHQAVGTLGLSYLFGGCNEAVVQKPEPAKVVAAPTPTPPAPPADSDGDGVIDEKDECSGTLAGTKVDATGCPETVKAIEDNWVLKGVNFETGSDKIKAGSSTVLDEAADILSDILVKNT
jgi:OOP family OmpA-OmpF porin